MPLSPTAGRRRLLYVSAGAVGIIAAAYTGYWWFIRHELTSTVDGWVAAHRAEGWDIRHGAPGSGGFPGTVRVHYPGPVVRAPRNEGGWQWTADGVELALDPWSPLRLRVLSPGRHVFRPAGSEPDAAITGTAEDLRAQIDFADETPDIDLSARTVSATTARGDTVGLAQLEVRVAPPAALADGPGDLRVSADARGVTLPERLPLPFGRSVQTVRTDMQIVGAGAAGFTPQQILAWRDAGGYVRIDDLTVAYGPLTVGAVGRLALDAAGQPTGTLDARVAGAVATVDALSESGLIPDDAALGARIVLTMMRTTPGDGGPPVVPLPIRLERRVLHVGPFSLPPLPPVRWPVDPRPAIPALPGPPESR